ncbi:carboxymuconolactone decarboxylase family protein [Streptomyces qinglanensis]|uniref:4-carboxymuconolactone decarboxylase n=1 Tax=Streptomyces qinglanensis TaxID=943816 RepID=A0A1H9R8U6_9ACTN|nr:carboxymuconolactone decarboxylase family protein [Streptomyces qinglanensis]SER68955.1 4-carboxymuconolactone decarboxylase [Streptomyces qinglanensis]
MPDEHARRMARGREMMRRISPERGESMVAELRAVAPDFEELLVGIAFADVWTRSVLSLRERALVRLGALTALGSPDAAVAANIDSAQHIGLSDEEISEAFLQTIPYCGFPHVIGALMALKSMRESEPAGGAGPRGHTTSEEP